MEGNTGAIRFVGFGSYNLEGEGEIDGKIKIIKVGDMSTYSFSNLNILQNVVEGISKWVSIESDENIQSWFTKDNPTVVHKYKKFNLYPRTYLSDYAEIKRYLRDTIIPQNSVNKQSEIDSIN